MTLLHCLSTSKWYVGYELVEHKFGTIVGKW
jgi:hypothetical protein